MASTSSMPADCYQVSYFVTIVIAGKVVHNYVLSRIMNTISALQCVFVYIVTQRFKKRGFMVPTDGSPTDSSQDVPVTSASEDGHTTEETEESADQVSQPPGPPIPPTHTHTPMHFGAILLAILDLLIYLCVYFRPHLYSFCAGYDRRSHGDRRRPKAKTTAENSC